MKVPLANNDKTISVDKITLNVTLEGGEKAQVEYDVKGGVPVFDKSQNKYVDSAEKAEADKKAAEELMLL